MTELEAGQLDQEITRLQMELGLKLALREVARTGTGYPPARDGDLKYHLDEEDIALDLETKEGDMLLAHLLLNGVVFVGSGGFFAQPGHVVTIHVLCSDVFAYALADAEDLPYNQLATVYQLWRKDPMWGPIAWAITRRKTMPIQPVVVRLYEAGYDVEALVRGELPSV